MRSPDLSTEQALHFEGTPLTVVFHNNRPAVTAEQLGIALNYSEPRKSIINLFNQNRDEFEEGVDWVVIKSMTTGGTKDITAFYREGAMLIAMFSQQPKAKAFRRWAKRFLAAEFERQEAPGRELPRQELPESDPMVITNLIRLNRLMSRAEENIENLFSRMESLAARMETLEKQSAPQAPPQQSHMFTPKEPQRMCIMSRIGYNGNRRWTIEEENYVIENYGRKTVAEIAKDIGRTEDAVGSRLVSLRIRCR